MSAAPRQHPRGRADAYLTMALLSLFWGYSWIAAKVATGDAAPIVVAVLRNGIGAVGLLGVLVATGRSLRPPPFGPTLVYGLLQTAGFQFIQTVAVSLGGAGKTSILAYTMPFWLVLLAWPLLGERILPLRWVALALAVAGLVFIVLPLESRSMGANALAVLAGFVWAASAVWAIRIRRTASYDLLSLTAWQMVWGSLALAPALLVLPWHARWTGALVGSVLFLGFVSGAAGWAMWLYLLSRLPPSAAGVASLATPVVAVVLSAIHLGEIPTGRELAGIACIVVALVVNARVGAPRARGAAAARTAP